jgi:hypothetical protein
VGILENLGIEPLDVIQITIYSINSISFEYVHFCKQEDMSWRVRGRGQLSHAIELACGAALRLRVLELQWPTILVEMIEDILRDFADMDSHVKQQMHMLMDSL